MKLGMPFNIGAHQILILLIDSDLIRWHTLMTLAIMTETHVLPRGSFFTLHRVWKTNLFKILILLWFTLYSFLGSMMTYSDVVQWFFNCIVLWMFMLLLQLSFMFLYLATLNMRSYKWIVALFGYSYELLSL